MKTALITGASGALGSAFSRAFREAGYRVVATDRRGSDTECDAFVELDLAAACASPEALEEAARRLRSALPGGELAVLVNNAAVQNLGGVGEVTLADWSETFITNVAAPLFLTQTLLAELERAGGVVINIGSVHARATKPRFVAYAASKAALAGLTRAMAVDLGPRVRAVCVQPAAVASAMLEAGFANRPEALGELARHHPLGRIARPVEIARAVVFLASDGASFANGAAFDFDGGVLSRLHDPE